MGRQCYCSVMGYKSSLHIDPAGYLYYAGIFNGPWGSGTVDFDPGTGVANLTAPSSVDNVFFAKYNIGNSPLSFSLIAFTVETINNTNQLQWITSTELNNDYYEIERSAEGKNYTPIGWKDGNGNSSQPVFYEFNDIKPIIGNNYYRLKQVDFNGNIHYSNTIRAEIIKQEENCYFFEESGIFRLFCKNNGNIIVFDSNGKVAQSIQNISEYIPVEIDLSSKAPGMYVIRYYDGYSIKFIKLFNH